MRRTNSMPVLLCLFLVWPFGAFLNTLSLYKKSWAKNIFWIFSGFFGYSIYITEGGDINRYIEQFNLFSESSLSMESFFNTVSTGEGKYVDILSHLITYSVSNLTDDYRVYIGILCLIFGYFYSRNIWYLIEVKNVKLDIYSLYFIINFSIIVSFWSVYNFRFFTACQMFLFGILPFLIEKDRSKILISYLSIFMHFSFAIPVFIFTVFLILPKKKEFYFWAFLLSFVVSEVNLDFIRQFIDYLPSIYGTRVGGYLNEDYLAKRIDHVEILNFWAAYYDDALRYGILIVIICIRIKRWENFNYHSGLNQLLCFTLMFFSSSNLFSNQPSLSRFVVVSSLFCLSLFYVYFSIIDDGIFKKKVVWLSLPFFAFYDIVSLRIALDSFSIHTIFGNFFTVFLDKELFSIAKIIL